MIFKNYKISENKKPQLKFVKNSISQYDDKKSKTVNFNLKKKTFFKVLNRFYSVIYRLIIRKMHFKYKKK